MRCQIEVAGIVAECQIKYDGTLSFAEGFVVSGKEPDFCIELNSKNFEYELRLLEKYGEVLPPDKDIKLTRRMERLFIYHQFLEHIASYNLVLLHASAVTDGKNTYIFTAESGVGKTTRAQLFIQNHPEFYFLNGDKPLIKVEDNQLVAYGSPWKGKEGWGTDGHAPLEAIFLVERAKETTIRELTLMEAYDSLLKHTYIPANTENVIKTLQLLQEFQGKVRVFLFKSQATSNAVEEAYSIATL